MTMRFTRLSVRGRAEHFGSNRGPSIPTVSNYVPTRPAQWPAGYAEIEAASHEAQDSPEFMDFVRDVVNLPVEMAPAVAEAIGQKRWKVSPNPLGAIRTASHQEAKRLGIQ
jgi:hypothetical protein